MWRAYQHFSRQMLQAQNGNYYSKAVGAASQ